MNLEKKTIKELKTPQKEAFTEKREDLELVKQLLEEKFGQERLPKDLVLEMVNIRKEIRNEIENENFVAELDEIIDSRIKLLVAKICHLDFEDEQELDQNQRELLSSLRLYFDSYRLAHNAGKFRSNVDEIKAKIIKDSGDRKTNFYSEKDKQEELIAGLKEKYENAGFSEEEFKQLVEICDLKDLENLPIHEIKMMGKIKDIFSRFMQGDKTKYVGLSAALMVPAFIQGYAPMLFADAFKSSHVDIKQIILYALASSTGAGLSVLTQKHYKDFINKNYQKEGGISEFTANNLTEFPPDEIQKFGQETVKQRARRGRDSYEDVLNAFSFDILPAITTLTTSAVVLYEKSPILAGGTILASGITIVLEKYFQKVGKFWEKERDSERTSEQMAQRLNEQLNAHMEIILAGEKEKFFHEIKEFIEKEKLAQSSRAFFDVLQNAFFRFSGAINFTLAGVASLLAGGSPDKAVAAILYSGNFNQGIQDLLSTKKMLLRSLRNIMQMELMFNGYAEEENEKEKSRIGVNQIESGDINLKDVNVELDGKQILSGVNLDIPTGSMAYLEGASGAGKTTLMKIISGYYRPTSGEVKFGGVEVENIKKTGEQSIYNKIAYLSQFPYLFEESLKNNLKFGQGKEITDDKIKEVLRDVGLGERFRDLNEKLFGGLGDSGKTSGGETSRIGLARVLLKIRNSDCRLVFLDEPTASVDEATKKDIADVINKEKAKRPETTFIVISHDKQFVEMLSCDVKIKMDKGKII
ncbi:ABC transporter ATP-binding protein/permease [Candidatus Gracilibacteria bacterium]|nr:ABC transporter ATP-binding protein/permease [Candidatus Gracilibacteria bacterium]